MRRAQLAILSGLVTELCLLRNSCDDPADRFELGVLIMEFAPALSRPCDPDDEPATPPVANTEEPW